MEVVRKKAAPQSPAEEATSVDDFESARLTPPVVTAVTAALAPTTTRVPTPPSPPTIVRANAVVPADLARTENPLYFDAADTEQLLAFVNGPAPEEAGPVTCEIRRDKKGMGKGSHPVYYLHLERSNIKDASKTDKVFMLAGRKRKKCKTSNYLISSDAIDLSKDSDSYVAKLRANFVGTNFTIFDDGVNMKEKSLKTGQDYRKELGAIKYAANVLGSKGPRKMEVTLPAMDHNQRPMEFKPLRESDSMHERVKLNRLDDLIQLENKMPVWSEKSMAYELKFSGRVTEASVKNFQIIHPQEPSYKILQFGRTGEHTFSMDYQYPMTAVQAFAICLSSLDGKWACE